MAFLFPTSIQIQAHALLYQSKKGKERKGGSKITSASKGIELLGSTKKT
jgi:hypothetical protein